MKDKNKTITSFQSEIAKKLKINIKNHTRNLASAKIHDFVHKAIYPGSEIKKATKKQIKLGEKINLNLENDSMRVASAKIKDKLNNINKNAIKKLNLSPGDKVIKKSKLSINGKEIERTKEYIVSSIGKNNRVYFKGGNGRGAWPTEVEKVESN